MESTYSQLYRCLYSPLCYAFVDDTDVAHCSSLTSTADNIITEMKDVVHHWEGSLHKTGGALHVDKSFWYLIHFIWENNSWRYSSIDEQPGKLYVRGVSGNLKYLACLEPSKAPETLGVFLAMDGNNSEQISQPQKKALLCKSNLY